MSVYHLCILLCHTSLAVKRLRPDDGLRHSETEITYSCELKCEFCKAGSSSCAASGLRSLLLHLNSKL